MIFTMFLGGGGNPDNGGGNPDAGTQDPDPFTSSVAYKTDGIMCPSFSVKKNGADECDYEQCPTGQFVNVKYTGANAAG